MSDLKNIDWNKASELGLVEKINREVLHPLGLAMTRNPEKGISEGLLISDDGEWEYAPNMKTTILPDEVVREAIKAV
jgi:hypothetical protein